MAKVASSLIAKRYADAIFALAQDMNALEAVERDLKIIAQTASEFTEVQQFFSSPLLAREAKAKALEALAGKLRMHALTSQFLQRLALNQRLSLLPLIASTFATLAANARGEVFADIISAEPLDARYISAITDAVSKGLGKGVIAQTSINPSLIGGAAIRVDGQTLDYSIAGHLRRMRLGMLRSTST